MTLGIPKPFAPKTLAAPPKRRVIDKLKDGLQIAAWCIAAVVVLMIYLRYLGFTVGINIAAIGMFFLTIAIAFVKASRYAEDAVVIAGSVVCFMGIFAFCPMSLMWEWATLAISLLLIVAIEVIRFIRSVVQTAEKVGNEVIETVTRIVSHDVGRHDDQVTPPKHRVRAPHGIREWILSALLGILVFCLSNAFRFLAYAIWSPANIIFAATAAIGLGVIGMMVVAFSRANNASEDLLAGASIAVGWGGLYLAWPHPMWHILVLLAVMSLLVGSTVGPIISRRIMRLNAAHQALTAPALQA